jgi:hydroxyquinol 1,2-dioxygenase
MSTLVEKEITENVVRQLKNCGNERLKEVSESLIRHLHAFISEVELAPDEWFFAINFLTKTGQICDEKRQEYILLSDILGASMLVDAIANRKPAGATESSVLGPFYVEGAPEVALGGDLAAIEGSRVRVSGKVTTLDGSPIKGALLDVWQTAPNGLYHVQDPDQPEHHLCGKLHSDNYGNYSFTTLKPVSYAIPSDGPVGKYLLDMGRHPYRPAHIHFIVSAPGFKPVVTQLFTEGDEYLDSDAVFGVKKSLVVPYVKGSADRYEVSYDFVLEQQ